MNCSRRIRKRFSKLVLIVLLFFIITSPIVTAEDNFLWEVSGPEGDFYLMGSLHYMVEGAYPLNDEVYNRLADSDTLVVEVDTREINQFEVQNLINQLGMLEPGESLEDILEPELYQRVQEILEPQGITAAQFNQFKPWYIGLLISNFAGYEMEAEIIEGIDYHILAEAVELELEVKELESLEYQYNMFADLEQELQIEMISDAFDDLDKGENYSQDLAELWLDGDVDGFYEMFFQNQSDSDAREEYYRKLFDERDVEMKENIKEMLAGDDELFIVVGAGHVVGDKGLLYLFEQAGYDINQL